MMNWRDRVTVDPCRCNGKNWVAGMRFVLRLLLLLLPVLFLASIACAQDSPPSLANGPSPEPQKTLQSYDLAQAFDIACRNYRLGPDDQLNVVFQTDLNIPVGAFKLDTLDKIRITCLIDPQLSSEVTIGPDGMVFVKGIGEIEAAGLKPDELARNIEKKYIETKVFLPDISERDLSNFRLVTVEVLRFYEKISKAIDALRSLSSRVLPVKPDGTVDLPLLRQPVPCAGDTVAEVEETITKLYRERVLDGIVVSMSLAAARSSKFYALGEVNRPGAYDIHRPVTVRHALAVAGGHKADNADLTSVLLISKDSEGKPVGQRLDVKKILEAEDTSSPILVKPYDVLFVPQRSITDVNTFMDEYVRVVTGIKPLAGSLISKP